MMMKNFRLILLILTALLTTNFLTAQCPSGSVTLTTQAEVDAFVTNYPSCTFIKGHLKIAGNNITDVSNLSYIVKTKGDFKIENTPSLTTISFNNLTTVGHGFYIKKTGATSVTFENLETANGNNQPFFISSNPVLKNLNLPKLHSIKGKLSIVANPTLLVVDLPSFIEHGITDEGYIMIKNNQNLQSINLENFAVASSIGIENNESLISVNLKNLRYVGTSNYVTGRLRIKGNSRLTTLNLDKLGGAFYIEIEDTKITSLNLNKVSSAEKELVIKNNSKLTNFDLSSFKEVRHLKIQNNQNLISLNSLQNLTNIYRDLTVTDNASLTDCSGLCNIINNGGVAGLTTISNNPSGCGSQIELIKSCVSLAIDDMVDNQFTVYPNPTHHILNIKSKNPIEKVEIFSIQGKKVFEIKNSNKMNLKTLSSGVYFVKIYSNNSFRSKKLMID